MAETPESVYDWNKLLVGESGQEEKMTSTGAREPPEPTAVQHVHQGLDVTRGGRALIQ